MEALCSTQNGRSILINSFVRSYVCLFVFVARHFDRTVPNSAIVFVPQRYQTIDDSLNFFDSLAINTNEHIQVHWHFLLLTQFQFGWWTINSRSYLEKVCDIFFIAVEIEVSTRNASNKRLNFIYKWPR